MEAAPGLPVGQDSVIDLEGARVVPGLWDTHTHLLMYGESLQQLDLRSCRSRSELLRAVREWPGEWVHGGNWNEGAWDDPGWPTLSELEDASGGRPLYLARSDLHSALVNSAAMQLAGVSEGEVSGGRVADGAAYDLALLPFQAILPRVEPASALRAAVARLHAYGIVGVVDQRIKDYPELHRVLPLYRQEKPRLRIHCNLPQHSLPEIEALGLTFGFGDDWVRLGHVKFFADGSLGSRTARMLEPYAGTSERGLWVTPEHELRRDFAHAHSRGFPVSIHAIGDEAVDRVLRVFEEVGTHPLDRIEHVQYCRPEWASRMARLGIVASMQPLHLVDDRPTSELLVGERSRDYYRLNTLQQAGVRLNFGSDAPVALPDPWLGIQAASERRLGSDPPWYPEECISPEAALEAYTRPSLGWQKVGALEPGFYADFVALQDGKVRVTVVGGEVVYEG